MARPRYRMRDLFFQTTAEEFVLNHCPSCGLLFLLEEGVRDRLSDFYPAGYWWRPAGPLSGLERRYREWMVRRDHLRFVLASLPEPGGLRLLDIGCGAGTFLKAAREAGFDAYGLESSEEAAAIASGEVPGRVWKGDEALLEERGERFDAVTLFHALEHMPDPFRYLKAVRRLLNDGGALFVQVPNSRSLQARIFGPRWYGLDCPRHLYNYSEFSALHLLGRAGFRIRRVRHFSLRDNAAALASSLFPGLDPMSQRVRNLRAGRASPVSTLRTLVYLPLFVLAQPLSYLEAVVGRGATITVFATAD